MNPVRDLLYGAAAAVAVAAIGWACAQVFAPEPAPQHRTTTCVMHAAGFQECR